MRSFVDNLRMPPESFRGVVVPLCLPLTEQMEIDYESMDRLVEFQIACGIDGFWINGSSGEFYALHIEERLEVLSYVLAKVARRVPVIAQVGDTASRLVLGQAFAALDAGADVLAMVPPFYVTSTQEELKQHYRLVAQEVKQPVFHYHVPIFCKCSLNVSSMLELAAEGVLIGVKDSANSQDQFARLVRNIDRGGFPMRCFNGNSALMDSGYYAGAHGFMGAIINILPAQCKRAYEASQRADWELLRSLNEPLRDLFDTIASLDHPISFFWLNKFVLKELGIITSDTLFPPLSCGNKNVKDRLRNSLIPMIRELTPMAAYAC